MAQAQLQLMRLGTSKDDFDNDSDSSSDECDGMSFKQLKQRTTHLLESEKFSDVTFIVGSDGKTKTFRAHKLIMAMSSEAFEAMFYGAHADKDHKVRIVDIHPNGFECMLRYIYSDTNSFLSVEDAFYTLKAADKYLLKHLSKLCTSYIRQNLLPTQLCALILSDEYLFNLYFDDMFKVMVQKDTQAILNSEYFLDLNQQSILKLLKCKSCTVSEFKLFQTLYEWATVNCKREKNMCDTLSIRDYLEPFLPYIRFLSMSTNEFLEISKTDLFTGEEKFAVLANILNPDCTTLPSTFCNNRLKRLKSGQHRSCKRQCFE